MKKFKVIPFDEQNLNERLDMFLTDVFESLSRNKIQTHIKDGKFLVNDNKVKTGYLIKEEDILTYSEDIFEEEIDYDINPVNLNLDIIYEDEYFAVINKPKGLVVHPADSYDGDTLVHGLLYQFKDNLSSINGKERPGIIHRLDKDTSGLIIIAKDDEAHVILSKEISEHKIKRHYYTICYGLFTETNGTIDMPIQRDPKHRIKMAALKGGRDSLTHFNVLEQYRNHSLLDVELITGRTHQIRVHLKAINHPILGDELYGPRNVYGNIGQYLHAYKLSLKHPITKKEMVFETPLPDYFKDVIKELN